MIDERMTADAVKRFRSEAPYNKLQSIRNDTELLEANIRRYETLQDAVFYAKLLSQKYNVLARELETMCEDVEILSSADC